MSPRSHCGSGASICGRHRGGGLPVVGALFDLNAAQLPGALDRLSGEMNASTAGVLADESLSVRSAILGRLRQASYRGDTGMASLSQAFASNEELGSAQPPGTDPLKYFSIFDGGNAVVKNKSQSNQTNQIGPPPDPTPTYPSSTVN